MTEIDSFCATFTNLDLAERMELDSFCATFADAERMELDDSSAKPRVLIYDAPKAFIAYMRGIVKKECPWMTLKQIKMEIEERWLYLPNKQKYHFLEMPKKRSLKEFLSVDKLF